MSKLKSIVEHDAWSFTGQFDEQNASKDQPPRTSEIRKRLFAELRRIRDFLDIRHALEYVFKAGCCLYREGSSEVESRFERKKALLHDAKAKKLLAELKRHRRCDIPGTGPRTKTKPDKLTRASDFLEKGLDTMDYDHLRAEALLQLRAIEIKGRPEARKSARRSNLWSKRFPRCHGRTNYGHR